MSTTLFDELLKSTQEMVNIENGVQEAQIIRNYEIPDVKQLRAQLNLKQNELAQAVGVSTALVQSWEQKRRFPCGASLKLLRLIEKNPSLLKTLFAV